MKKFLKVIGILFLLIIGVITFVYFKYNESLPEGKTGEEADALANKMLTALQHEVYENVEILEWSFIGKNFYKWKKREGIVEVSWDNNKVILHTQSPELNKAFTNGKETEDKQLIEQAIKSFNNDSFWLVAPHKVFDNGVERRLVKYNDKDALLVTYTSGGSTPGDSYLWILNDEGFPVSFKMWTSIIPIGGLEASWNQWTNTSTGIKLPTNHKLDLLGLNINMGIPKASNPKSDALANKILKAINHEAYKTTNHLEWGFGGRRFYKWNKKEHIVEVKWDTTKVILHPDHLDKSEVYFNGKLSNKENISSIKRAEALFNNDSFWLVAPHKLFESGIIRTIKKVDGKEALLVKYTTGGTTPGDSYLWILDENYVPKSYKMYVPSMKMEGVPATWQDWITTDSGTLLPTNHVFGKGRNLSMGEVKGYN